MSFSLNGNVVEIVAEYVEGFDEDPGLLCYFCETILDLEFDYTCIICGTLACDKHNDICQADEAERTEDCDLVTCYVCVKRHTESQHSGSVEVYE